MRRGRVAERIFKQTNEEETQTMNNIFYIIGVVVVVGVVLGYFGFR